jgi:Transposase DDE domain
LTPKTCPSWLTRETLAARPDSLVLREARSQLDTRGFRTRQITLVTTLLDAVVYPVAELAELYRRRWQVETSPAHLKTTMRMDVLPCKTVPGVLKELTVFAIIYNLVRLVIGQSARLQHIDRERISVVEALRWRGAPSTGIPLAALIVNPLRPHRVAPRVKKRRPKPFPLMITPRQQLRQQLIQHACRS